MPHSWAYIEDVGRAAAILGTQEKGLGKVWIAPHASAMTQGEVFEITCPILGIQPQYSVFSPLMMQLGGLFIPEAQATVEMMYEFTQPFFVDTSKFNQAFQARAASMREGSQRTVDWYLIHEGFCQQIPALRESGGRQGNE